MYVETTVRYFLIHNIMMRKFHNASDLGGNQLGRRGTEAMHYEIVYCNINLLHFNFIYY